MERCQLCGSGNVWMKSELNKTDSLVRRFASNMNDERTVAAIAP
jgi:hypothetical protein